MTTPSGVAVERLEEIPVEIGYTNWRGEYAVRKIIPLRTWFGATDWHPEPQWLLTAIDVEKGAERDFAIKDIGLRSSEAVSGDGWRPIETHPRDGSQFLAFSEALGGIWHACFAWDDRLVVWSDEGGLKLFRDASKWRPLPVAPTPQDEGSEE